MNWKTKEILDTAIDNINDEEVFSQDQIGKLKDLIYTIGNAIERECDVNKPSVNM